MRPSFARLVTHIASLCEPAEQMAMMKAGQLIRAFSGGSEHLSLWYSAYTEPISRAFIPAVTQKTSADPSWDNTEQRGFISSIAIANLVLQQHQAEIHHLNLMRITSTKKKPQTVMSGLLVKVKPRSEYGICKLL